MKFKVGDYVVVTKMPAFGAHYPNKGKITHIDSKEAGFSGKNQMIYRLNNEEFWCGQNYNEQVLEFDQQYLNMQTIKEFLEVKDD